MSAAIIDFPDPLVLLKAQRDALDAEYYCAAEYGAPGDDGELAENRQRGGLPVDGRAFQLAA